MALIIKGEAIRQNFTLIQNSVSKSLTEADILTPISPANECCPDNLLALAELGFTNEFYNDKHAPTFDWNNNFISAVMYLQKFVGGEWVNVATLNNTTYGKYSAFGFYNTIYTEKKIGYEIDWALVLSNNGEGNYRVKCTGTAINGATIDKYSLEFNLLTYTADRAERTVRLEWWLNGNLGDPNNDLIKRDFGVLNWYNQIRLPDSKFGWDENETTREFYKIQDGKQVWTKNSDVEIYTLKTCRLPNEVRRFFKYDLLNGSEIRITDFNSDNATSHVNRYVKPQGGFKPNYVDGSKIASVEMKFEQLYQNNDHKRS